jgi:hypothetical protein
MSNRPDGATTISPLHRQSPEESAAPRRAARNRARAVPAVVDSTLLEQAVALLEYCAGRGTTPSSETVAAVRAAEEASARESARRDGAQTRSAVGMDDLVQAHRQLSALAYPATPRSVTYLRRMRREHGRRFVGLLGAVPVVRTLLLVAVVTLILFAVFAALPGAREVVGSGARAADPLSFGDRLLRELFLVVAALLGAAFAALYRAGSYVLAGTYDPHYTYTYVVRLVLGVLAGLLIAELVPLEDVAGVGSLTTPLLALIGGFSASVAYALLLRLVAAAETLVQGGREDRDAARIAHARAAAVTGAEAERRQHFERAVELRESLRTGDIAAATHRVDLLVDALRAT